MSAHSQRFPRPYGDTDDVIGRARSHATDPGHSLFHSLVATNSSWGTTIARLTLGLVMLPHALQKTVGLFGGPGFGQTFHMFSAQVGGVGAFLIIIGELLGAISLVIGGLTRIGAIAIGIIMAGAIATVHAPNGFFMNWFGQQHGEGFEYHLLALGLVMLCLFQGGGHLSVDRFLSRWRPAEGGGVSPALEQD